SESRSTKSRSKGNRSCVQTTSVSQPGTRTQRGGVRTEGVPYRKRPLLVNVPNALTSGVPSRPVQLKAPAAEQLVRTRTAGASSPALVLRLLARAVRPAGAAAVTGAAATTATAAPIAVGRVPTYTA